MQRANHKHHRYNITALLLVVVLVCTTAPLQWLHQLSHSESQHCEEETHCTNTNPCHITLHHTHSGAQSCHHPQHITQQTEDCSFCNYLSQHRQLHYVAPTLPQITHNTGLVATYSPHIKSRALVFALEYTNKGPPAV